MKHYFLWIFIIGLILVGCDNDNYGVQYENLSSYEVEVTQFSPDEVVFILLPGEDYYAGSAGRAYGGSFIYTNAELVYQEAGYDDHTTTYTTIFRDR